MEDLQKQIEQYKKEKRKVVIYLDDEIIKRVSLETKQTLLETINNTGCKIVTSKEPSILLHYKKPVVIRYGIIPTYVATKLATKGSIIISGTY